jgi:hypothetical protein
VGGYPITPEAGRLALAEAADRSYESSMEHLRAEHSVMLSKRTLENMTHSVGSYWLSEDRRQWEDHRMLVRPIEAAMSPATCCVYADGAMSHVDGAWHEVRVGRVHSSAGSVDLKSSLARLCEVEEFGEQLLARALALGYGKADLRAFIADGAPWLWRMAQTRFTKAIQVLDFYHVCEHVCLCANTFFGEGSDESTRWSWHMKGLLRAGLVEESLREIASLRPRRSVEKAEAKRLLRGYLETNRQRMDYPRYEAMGLPIGSGEVEAQCKTLVQARCKQSGMRWGRRGIEALLRVRCGLQDGRFERAFERWNGKLVTWRAQNEPPHSKVA